jgi:hypothetical protein
MCITGTRGLACDANRGVEASRRLPFLASGLPFLDYAERVGERFAVAAGRSGVDNPVLGCVLDEECVEGDQTLHEPHCIPLPIDVDLDLRLDSPFAHRRCR